MVQIAKSIERIPVEFFVECKTSLGQNLYICGNCAELGNWNPLAGVCLETNRKSYPEWYSPSPILLKYFFKFK
jgi:hypothetical protein